MHRDQRPRILVAENAAVDVDRVALKRFRFDHPALTFESERQVAQRLQRFRVFFAEDTAHDLIVLSEHVATYGELALRPQRDG